MFLLVLCASDLMQDVMVLEIMTRETRHTFQILTRPVLHWRNVMLLTSFTYGFVSFSLLALFAGEMRHWGEGPFAACGPSPLGTVAACPGLE